MLVAAVDAARERARSIVRANESPPYARSAAREVAVDRPRVAQQRRTGAERRFDVGARGVVGDAGERGAAMEIARAALGERR